MLEKMLVDLREGLGMGRLTDALKRDDGSRSVEGHDVLR